METDAAVHEDDHAPQAKRRPRLLDGYLTVGQLAAELDVSERTLHRWHAIGQGPARAVIGNRILYRRATVERWLLKQEVERSKPR